MMLKVSSHIKKRLKIFEYLKNKSGPNGTLFLQETHSMKKNEIRWNDDFDGQIHYSHGKSNSCGVLITFFGSITYTVRKKASDKHGRILIIEALIDNAPYTPTHSCPPKMFSQPLPPTQINPPTTPNHPKNSSSHPHSPKIWLNKPHLLTSSKFFIYQVI